MTDVKIDIYTVDAFTDEAFGGNPAAVCLLPAAREAEWMQLVAREMNLSETAFLVRRDDEFDLRWFTPAAEVELCGHATLASAHVLWETGMLPEDVLARFHTQSGLLIARHRGEQIELDFPALATEPGEAPPEMLDALGASPTFVGHVGEKHLIEVADEAAVRSLAPDFGRLRALPGRAVMVTSLAGSQEYDFISRFFAPWIGIDEDPVTGSAHCALGPYWSAKLAKEKMRAYQASARGGKLGVELRGDRVLLRGRAVTILAGALRV